MTFFKIFAISVLTAVVLALINEAIIAMLPDNDLINFLVLAFIFLSVLFVASKIVEPKKKDNRRTLK